MSCIERKLKYFMERKENPGKIFYGKQGKSGKNILWKARKIREKYFLESNLKHGKIFYGKQGKSGKNILQNTDQVIV